MLKFQVGFSLKKKKKKFFLLIPEIQFYTAIYSNSLFKFPEKIII